MIKYRVRYRSDVKKGISYLEASRIEVQANAYEFYDLNNELVAVVPKTDVSNIERVEVKKKR